MRNVLLTNVANDPSSAAIASCCLVHAKEHSFTHSQPHSGAYLCVANNKGFQDFSAGMDMNGEKFAL